MGAFYSYDYINTVDRRLDGSQCGVVLSFFHLPLRGRTEVALSPEHIDLTLTLTNYFPVPTLSTILREGDR